MSTTHPPSAQRKWFARLAGPVRTIHLYLSMSASLGIAFFAFSGLIANLRDDKDTRATETVPVAALASPTTVATYLQEALRLPASPKIEEIGSDLFIATADLGDETLDISVYRTTAAMEITHWRALPPGMQLDRESLSAWCRERFHRAVEPSDDGDDPLSEQVVLRIDSVWNTRTITVNRSERRWGLSTTEHALAKTLTDLHTGRHASWIQHLIMDIIAITLLLSVVSGSMLGLVWMAKLRRRIMITLVFSGGLVCLLALLSGR